jgi:single-stranded-DNA-specific exonuclease
MLKGTGRSIEGINLYDLLKPSDELFLKFGGHKGACGFTMKAENFDAFRGQIAKRMAELKSADSTILERKNPAELALELGDVSLELARQLEMLAPFGAANPSPVFEIDNLKLGSISYMGAEKNHARFNVMGSGTRCQCVLFGKAHENEDVLREGSLVDIAVAVEENRWNGSCRLQLNVQEIKESKELIDE